MTRMTRIFALALAAVASAAVPAAAVAKKSDDGGRETRVNGRCDGGSTAKLEVEHESNGRIEAEFEVDQNRNGVSWTVVLRRNGRVAVSTRATTRAPSGSFSIERRLTDGPGRDRVTARATSPTGEVCTAAATI